MQRPKGLVLRAVSFRLSAFSPSGIAQSAKRIASARSRDHRLLTTDYRPEIETARSAYALRSALSPLLPSSVLSTRYSVLISLCAMRSALCCSLVCVNLGPLTRVHLDR